MLRGHFSFRCLINESKTPFLHKMNSTKEWNWRIPFVGVMAETFGVVGSGRPDKIWN